MKQVSTHYQSSSQVLSCFSNSYQSCQRHQFSINQTKTYSSINHHSFFSLGFLVQIYGLKSHKNLMPNHQLLREKNLQQLVDQKLQSNPVSFTSYSKSYQQACIQLVSCSCLSQLQQLEPLKFFAKPFCYFSKLQNSPYCKCHDFFYTWGNKLLLSCDFLATYTSPPDNRLCLSSHPCIVVLVTD